MGVETLTLAMTLAAIVLPVAFDAVTVQLTLPGATSLPTLSVGLALLWVMPLTRHA